MGVPIVTIGGNIGAGKTTHLQNFEQSITCEDNLTIKVEHEPLKEFLSFYGNNLKNLPEHFYKNPTDNAFPFQQGTVH